MQGASQDLVTTYKGTRGLLTPLLMKRPLMVDLDNRIRIHLVTQLNGPPGYTKQAPSNGTTHY